MGEAFLDYKKGGASGLDINGIIEDYYVYAGEKVSAGDFVEFAFGSNGDEKEIQVRPATTLPCDGVAKSSGEGGDNTAHKDIVSIYTIEDTRPTLASLPVGTLIKDTNSIFLGKPVIWKIADVNHEGYPDNSVTLIAERIVAIRPFDAKEPNNSNSNRQSYGNNRYSVSNIRQWLNSDAEAGMWYTAQHEADMPPSASYVDNGKNAYDTKAGFLNGFSQEFKSALLETTLETSINTADGGRSENVTDKMFLASRTEVGLEDERIAEGTVLPIFSNNVSRRACVTTEGIEDSNYGQDPYDNTTVWYWWLRTPASMTLDSLRHITPDGELAITKAYYSHLGVRPLCNLPSSIRVTQDEDGIYKLEF